MLERLSFVSLGLLLASACAGPDISDDTGVVVPDRPAYDEWILVEPEGAVCGNGTPYKFFVNYSDVSNDLMVVFEPGGGCWDFDSCTGRAGIRGAANVDGLPDDHIDAVAPIVPFFKRQYETNTFRDWNYVYVPYCTGDVHTGNAVAVYEDPRGEEEPIEFHHSGHANVASVIDWMAGEFTSVPRLFVTGCSAGGAGATVNYYDIRKGMPDVGEAYLLADSGPIFPSDSNSGPLHEKVYDAWQVESIFGGLPPTFDPDDFGSINRLIAEEFPDDRMAVTYFQRDFNYSLYSYERFYDFPPKEEILDMWAEDTAKLTSLYDEYDNLGYYLPYWRALNDSHCATIVTFDGTEIQELDMDMADYIDELLDESAPVGSYQESVQPDEDI